MTRYLFVLAIFLSVNLFSQPLKVTKNFAFKRGEMLIYRVHYGIIDAGEASVSISQEATKFGDKPTYHLVGTGKSAGTFDWFFKVRDRYDSFIDEETLLPQFFQRKVDEGGFIINQSYLFNQKQQTVTVGRDGTDIPRNASNKKYSVPEYTHDILSAFYFARNADMGGVKPGDYITVQTFFDEEIFPLQVKVIGRETIKTKAGKIRCVKLRPVIQQGRVFKEEEDLTMWVSDDLNRIPVRLQANLVVGSVKMDLKEYKGLANPLNIEK